MDKFTRHFIKQSTPKMNQDVVESLVVKMLPMAEKWLDDVFRAASLSFPEGLTYLSYKRYSPIGEFKISTKVDSTNKRIAETSRSDVYTVRYDFQYEWVDFDGVLKTEIISRNLQIPFIGDAGGITLAGKKIFLHPIMTDTVISPTTHTIFVRLMRDRIRFMKEYHSVKINKVHSNSGVVYSNLYRNSNKNNNKPFKKMSKAHSTVINYLLGKFGFSGFFNKYIGFVPEVGIKYEGMYNDNSFVFESTGVKPRTVIDKDYLPSKIYIRIPKEKMSNLVKEIITGIFYIIDNFPNIIKVEYFDDPRMWMQCLGYIIFNGNNSIGKIMEGVIEHYNSLDEYVDVVVTKQLKQKGINCSDFYSLLVLVMDNYSNWIVKNNSNINTMYGKELSVLYPIFFPLTRKLFSTAFKLNKSSLKKKLSIKEINEIMNKNFTTGIIYELNKPDTPKSNVNYPGDNKFFKITSTIIPQSTNISSESKASKKRITGDDPVNKIHASIVEAGGYLNITKPQPVGTGKINPYVTLDEFNNIVPNEETREFFEHLQYKLFNKVDD